MGRLTLAAEHATDGVNGLGSGNGGILIVASLS